MLRWKTNWQQSELGDDNGMRLRLCQLNFMMVIMKEAELDSRWQVVMVLVQFGYIQNV